MRPRTGARERRPVRVGLAAGSRPENRRRRAPKSAPSTPGCRPATRVPEKRPTPLRARVPGCRPATRVPEKRPTPLRGGAAPSASSTRCSPPRFDGTSAMRASAVRRRADLLEPAARRSSGGARCCPRTHPRRPVTPGARAGASRAASSPESHVEARPGTQDSCPCGSRVPDRATRVPRETPDTPSRGRRALRVRAGERARPLVTVARRSATNRHALQVRHLCRSA